MILRSQIRCLLCDNLVASIHRHDFRSCPCGSVSLDGGRDYMRVLTQASEGKLYEDASIRIKEDLTLEEGGHCLAVLRALAILRPHTPQQLGRATANQPLDMVLGSLKANIIWPSRNWEGLPSDIKVSKASVKRWLDLLVRNGLVARRTTGNNGRYRHYYRALVKLAAHPDVPDGLTKQTAAWNSTGHGSEGEDQ